MTIDKVLSNRNVDGQPYLSDIKEWLGIEIPIQQLSILQDKLSELLEVK